jgi:hypothetical protein
MTRLFKLLPAFLLCAAAFGQTTATTILGAVTDATGASIAGARVTAKNVATNVVSSTVTTGAGDYTIPQVDVGEYTVTVEAPGFKLATKTGIHLQIDEKVRADFQLEVGSQAEAITVKAESTTLQTDEASVGGTVEQRRLVELPLNGRNVGNFATLSAGVQYGSRSGFDGQGNTGASTAVGGVPIPGQSIALVTDGQRDNNMHATLDGVIANEARVNSVPWSPSPEAIEEVKIYTGSYSAEFGTNSGGQLIMVMRSGTNDLHGSAYEFLRNNKLDAEGYFQNYFNAPGAPPNPPTNLRQNQFGVVVGGPVVIPKLYHGRNKTFWLFNYEGRRRSQPGSINTYLVPTDLMRQGNFSELLNRRSASGAALPSVTIIDPFTSPGTPFPGNIIPASRIAPAATALLNYMPKAQNSLTDPLTGVNYLFPGVNTSNDNQYFAKIDHTFSASDKIFFRYATNVPRLFQETESSQFSYLVTARNQNYAGQWVHIFSPNVVNEFRFGFVTSNDDTFNPRANTSFEPSQIGITGFNVINDNNRPFTPRETGIPSMNITGVGFSIAEPDGGNGTDKNGLYQFGDSISINKGAHSFKAGVEYSWVYLFRLAANVPRGDFNFGGDVANNGFAAFLLGAPSSTDSPEGLPATDVRQYRLGLYFLDDWKVNRKLTLNLGLRWEYDSAAKDIDGLWRSAIWPNGLNNPPQFVPNQIRTTYNFYDASKKEFQPRFGLAYRASDNWVIRSGFGIYFNVNQLNNFTILNLNPPLSGSSNFANTYVNGAYVPGAALYNFNNPFGTLNPASAVNANALNTQNYQPYISQWTFDIQRRLPWASTLQVGYVGSKGVHLDNTVEKDAPNPFIATAANGFTVQNQRPYPFIIDNGITRPLTRLRFLDDGANFWYEGMQVNYRKEFSHGFLFTLAYTYSKAEMEGYGRNEGDGVLSNVYQNPRNRAADKSRLGYDATHYAVMSFVYEVPVPQSFNKLAKTVLGGWQTNGILTFHTGFPFTVGQGNIINSGNTPVRPDVVGNAVLSNPTINEWFNPNAFQIVSCQNTATPQTCHYGDSARGNLVGPGFHDGDVSLFKNFQIVERVRLQFRAEFFNLTNTPQFFVPGGTLNTGAAYRPTIGSGGTLVYPSQANIVQGPAAITSTVAAMRQIQFGLKLVW